MLNVDNLDNVDKASLLSQLVAIERAGVCYDTSAPNGQSGVTIITGKRPVLISAPHSARHWRAPMWKQEEEYTAALAIQLARDTQAHAIYGQYALNPDPHDDNDEGDYKRTLDQIVAAHPIRCVIDLHGARGDRDFAVALGTIEGETFAVYQDALCELFGQAGFTSDPPSSLDRLVVNPPRYTGGLRQPTITRYMWRQHAISAVQIELSAWVRVVERLPSASNARNGSAPDFRGDGTRIARLYAVLRDFILSV